MADDVSKRFALFFFGCVPARLALAYAAYRHPASRVLAALFAAIGTAFLVIFAMGWRATGPETFGAPIWWNALRPVHGALYLCAAYVLATGRGRGTAWVPVALDAALGLASFVAYHAHAHAHARSAPASKTGP